MRRHKAISHRAKTIRPYFFINKIFTFYCKIYYMFTLCYRNNYKSVGDNSYIRDI
jgi:hypothetical protein